MSPGMKLIYDAEGTDEQCMYPRASVLGGIVLGHGYKVKSSWNIIVDLMKAGVAKPRAYQFVSASGLIGWRAKEWIKINGAQEFALPVKHQMRLFKLQYRAVVEDTQFVYNRTEYWINYQWYTPWNELHEKVKAILIDLKFCGRLTKRNCAKLSACVEKNSVSELTKVMSKRLYWKLQGVSKDRFNRRLEYLGRR